MKKTSPLKRRLDIQLFAVSESQTHYSAVVVDGRLRHAVGVDPEVHARADAELKRRLQYLEEVAINRHNRPPVGRVD
jgi:hypothetical protein